MKKRVAPVIQFAILVAMPLLAAQRADAQSYPSRTVTIITPFAAGSVTDTTARQIAQHLQDALGQPFVVEIRGGESCRSRRTAGRECRGAREARWPHAPDYDQLHTFRSA